jgi:hypothetical protein
MMIEMQDGPKEYPKKEAEEVAQEEGDKPEEEVKQEEAPKVDAPAEDEVEVPEETEEDLERKRKEEQKRISEEKKAKLRERKKEVDIFANYEAFKGTCTTMTIKTGLVVKFLPNGDIMQVNTKESLNKKTNKATKAIVGDASK